MAVRIGLLGDIGYIAKNLKSIFRNHQNFILTTLEIPNFTEVKNCDFILDVSGPNSQLKIKNAQKSWIEVHSLEKQKKLLEIVVQVKIPYYRIASIYDLMPEHSESHYSIIGKGLNQQLKAYKGDVAGGLVYCTNLYGGIDSLSIVDLIRDRNLDNLNLLIENPTANRDFLHIETFLNFIMLDLMKPNPEPRFREILVATGFQFSVGELYGGVNSETESKVGILTDWEANLKLKEQGIDFISLKSELAEYMFKK